MNHLNEFEEIRREYIDNRTIRKLVINDLVDNGKITRRDCSLMFSYQLSSSDCAPEVLALIYKTILKYDKEIKRPSPEYFFSERELQDSLSLLKRESFDGYPIKFENVVKLSPKNEFLICLSAQQIYDLSMNKVLRIRADMQRESEIISTKEVKVPCVAFDPEKSDEISDNFLQGNQHPNTIRFHLNTDGDLSFEYDKENNTIIIHKGLLANIDGNHRISGLINAITKNHSIKNEYVIPVILTIGTPEMARDIIVQEEKRTAIDKEHIESYKCKEGNKIVALLKQEPDLEEIYGFCTTSTQHIAGGGFIVEHIMADAINKFFNLKKVLRKDVREEYARYLYDILMEYYDYTDSLYHNYIKTYTKHRQYNMSDEYTSYGLVYMASKLYNSPTRIDDFRTWLCKIDLLKEKNARFVYGDNRIISFIKSTE